MTTLHRKMNQRPIRSRNLQSRLPSHSNPSPQSTISSIHRPPHLISLNPNQYHRQSRYGQTATISTRHRISPPNTRPRQPTTNQHPNTITLPVNPTTFSPPQTIILSPCLTTRSMTQRHQASLITSPTQRRRRRLIIHRPNRRSRNRSPTLSLRRNIPLPITIQRHLRIIHGLTITRYNDINTTSHRRNRIISKTYRINRLVPQIIRQSHNRTLVFKVITRGASRKSSQTNKYTKSRQTQHQHDTANHTPSQNQQTSQAQTRPLQQLKGRQVLRQLLATTPTHRTLIGNTQPHQNVRDRPQNARSSYRDRPPATPPITIRSQTTLPTTVSLSSISLTSRRQHTTLTKYATNHKLTTHNHHQPQNLHKLHHLHIRSPQGTPNNEPNNHSHLPLTRQRPPPNLKHQHQPQRPRNLHLKLNRHQHSNHHLNHTILTTTIQEYPVGTALHGPLGSTHNLNTTGRNADRFVTRQLATVTLTPLSV